MCLKNKAVVLVHDKNRWLPELKGQRKEQLSFPFNQRHIGIYDGNG